jgi:hypothetical protein
MKRTLLLILNLCIALQVFSQSQQGFSYQAVIRNSQGQPIVNQALVVKITLQDEGGNSIYFSEIHEVVSSPQGIFSISVGQGEVINGSLDATPWSINNIFINVQVDISGSGSNFSELGTSRIMSVPYAFYAASGNVGPAGDPGPKGDPGLNGQSAYELWLSLGNLGSEEAFLSSLIGAQGEIGVGITGIQHNINGSLTIFYSNNSSYTTGIITGAQGDKGPKGDPGQDGLHGKSAYELWLQQGYEGSVVDFLESLVGETGLTGVGIINTVNNGNGTYTFEYSDGSSFTTSSLIGPQGEQGVKGDKGDKGDTGAPGSGLQNRGSWVTGTTYNPGDYVFAVSSISPDVNSMWIVQSEISFVSNTSPKNELSKWAEFQAPQGEQGPPGPVAEGSAGQTLFHDGDKWVASSIIFKGGKYVGVGTDTPSEMLDINGRIRIRDESAEEGKVLTSDKFGVGTWQNAGSRWTLSGNNIYRTTGFVGIGTQTPLAPLHVAGSNTVTVGTSGVFLDLQNTSGDLTGRMTGIRFKNSNSTGYKAAIFFNRTETFGRGDMHFAINNLASTAEVSRSNSLMVLTRSGNLGVGTTSPQSKLDVSGGDPTEEEPIFAVRNNAGQLVFGVYQSGVRMYVDDSAAKSSRGGFAVGGLSGQNKAGEVEYFRVTPDSVRITLNTNTTTKSSRGGFAVGGLSGQNKSLIYNDLLFITPDSARIYLNEPTSKNSRGGFAVGGLSGQNKAGNTSNFMQLYPDNYFIGHNAGKSILLGQYNIFIGYEAGYSTTGHHGDMFPTDGDNNIFIGYQAGYANTIGEQNLYIGAFSGRLNEYGIDNTYLGSRSGEFNTGYGNTLLGAYAGGWHQLNNGSKNTFVGSRAGHYNTSGSNNVYVGREAGGYNASGSNNVYVGHLTGYNGSNASGNVFIGNMAGRYETGSNKLYIHNSDANSANALIFGDFATKQIRFNATAVGINGAPSDAQVLFVQDIRTTNDAPAIYGKDDVTQNYGVGVIGRGGYMGVQAQNPSTTGTNYGFYTFLSGTATGSTRYGLYVGASGATTNYGLYSTASGGTTNWAGYFVGNVYISGTLSNPSDLNLKTNIKPIPFAIDKINQIEGVYFEWKKDVSFAKKDSRREGKENELDNVPAGIQVGVIAQDVEKVLPEIVITDGEGVKSVDYSKLTPLLIQAIKEQQLLIESQNQKIEELSVRLENIEKLLNEK